MHARLTGCRGFCPPGCATGVVLTIEPGLYIPDDEAFGPFAGIGVRIEDDVAITREQHACWLLRVPCCLSPSGRHCHLTQRAPPFICLAGTGREVLSADVPVAPDDVEALVGGS